MHGYGNVFQFTIHDRINQKKEEGFYNENWKMKSKNIKMKVFDNDDKRSIKKWNYKSY